jgi:hypothetical protein
VQLAFGAFFKELVSSLYSLFLLFFLQLHDCVAGFEQEKFELHKQHTKAIQELLEETNGRLQRMESEYNQQTDSTVGHSE